MPGFDDFDFLVGAWRITNERLATRLRGANDWEVFPATSRVEKVMRAPDGTFGGNLDQMFVPEKGFTGMTLRLYDPATALWSIHWTDTKSHRMFPPIVGRFDDGRGVFFGEDVEGGGAGEGAVRLDGGGAPGLGTVDVGGWGEDVGAELGDAVREVAHLLLPLWEKVPRRGG